VTDSPASPEKVQWPPSAETLALYADHTESTVAGNEAEAFLRDPRLRAALDLAEAVDYLAELRGVAYLGVKDLRTGAAWVTVNSRIAVSDGVSASGPSLPEAVAALKSKLEKERTP
jgi:hypothetical protein